MKRFIQKGPHDCAAAVCAMLFDLDYDAFPAEAPVSLLSWTDDREEEAERFISAFNVLAEKSGYSYLDFPVENGNFFFPKLGCKYFVVVRGADPSLAHCIAIDEYGTVFDPHPSAAAEPDLKSYDVTMFVELYRKS